MTLTHNPTTIRSTLHTAPASPSRRGRRLTILALAAAALLAGGTSPASASNGYPKAVAGGLLDYGPATYTGAGAAHIYCKPTPGAGFGYFINSPYGVYCHALIKNVDVFGQKQTFSAILNVTACTFADGTFTDKPYYGCSATGPKPKPRPANAATIGALNLIAAVSKIDGKVPTLLKRLSSDKAALTHHLAPADRGDIVKDVSRVEHELAFRFWMAMATPAQRTSIAKFFTALAKTLPTTTPRPLGKTKPTLPPAVKDVQNGGEGTDWESILHAGAQTAQLYEDAANAANNADAADFATTVEVALLVLVLL